MSAFHAGNPRLAYQSHDIHPLGDGDLEMFEEDSKMAAWDIGAEQIIQTSMPDSSPFAFYGPPLHQYLHQPESFFLRGVELERSCTAQVSPQTYQVPGLVAPTAQSYDSRGESPSCSLGSNESTSESENRLIWPSGFEHKQPFEVLPFPSLCISQLWSCEPVARPSHISMHTVQAVADIPAIGAQDEDHLNDIGTFNIADPEVESSTWQAHVTNCQESLNTTVAHLSKHTQRLRETFEAKEKPTDSGADGSDAESDEAEDVTAPNVDDNDGDEDYEPRASSRRKRKSVKQSTNLPRATPNKRQKVRHTSIPEPVSTKVCANCKYEAEDSTSLKRHVTQNHSSPYSCTFSFAGCDSTFGSKNEWKRHVSSQHIAEKYWECSRCPSSARPQSNNNHIRTKFNRKDLFTQHLKRMHAPHAVKKRGIRDARWEEEVRLLQESCMITRREPPSYTRCGKCNMDFDGPSCWDDRMEHVGRHLGDTEGGGEVIDNSLVEWALRERIIERVAGGKDKYKLVIDGDAGGQGSDEDAEGEDDDQ